MIDSYCHPRRLDGEEKMDNKQLVKQIEDWYKGLQDTNTHKDIILTVNPNKIDELLSLVYWRAVDTAKLIEFAREQVECLGLPSFVLVNDRVTAIAVLEGFAYIELERKCA